MGEGVQAAELSKRTVRLDSSLIRAMLADPKFYDAAPAFVWLRDAAVPTCKTGRCRPSMMQDVIFNFTRYFDMLARMPKAKHIRDDLKTYLEQRYGCKLQVEIVVKRDGRLVRLSF